ncbi:translocation/assembly module TamB domain-containing protein [Hirschia litorea]|uniref:Translocation/assembly module TamB domain-containing protein n=1 Tax=Hirschia litorea TaxID=1199156 RepID=A0ABW2IKH4_9PROT
MQFIPTPPDQDDTGTPDIPRRNPRVKLAIKVIGCALLGLLILVIVLRALIASPIGRAIIENQIESHTIAGQNIQIDGFRGDVLGNFGFSNLTVTDANGVWLDAEDAELQWKPLKLLFSKTLHIKAINIAQINAANKPEFPPSAPKEEPEPKSSKQSFIKRIIVEGVQFPRIFASQNTGLPQSSLNLSASADVGTSNSFFKLHLKSSGADDTGNSTSESKDTADIDLKWSLKKLLNGHVTLDIPNNGFIASFLPKPLEDNLSVDFTGKGDLKNWTGNGTAFLGTRNILSIDGVSEKSYATLNVLADLENVALANVVTQRLGSTLNANIEADLSKLKAAPLQIALTSRALTFETAGLANLQDREMVDNWTVNADILSLPMLTGQTDLNAESTKFDGVWKYAPKRSNLQGRLSTQNFKYAQRSVQSANIEFDAAYANSQLDLTTNLQAKAPISGISQADAMLGKQLKADFTGTYDTEAENLTIKRLALTSDALTTQVAGKVSRAGQTAITLQAGLSDIGKLTDQLSGPISIKGKLNRASSETDWVANLSSDKNTLVSQNEMISSLLHADTRLNAKANISPKNAIKFNTNLQSGTNIIAVTGQLSEQNLISDISAQIPVFQTESLNSTGIRLDTKINGLLSDLSLDSTLQINTLESGSNSLENASALIKANIKQGDTTANIQINALANTFPLTASTRISTEDGIKLDDLIAQWADLELTANASLSDENSPNANFKISGPLETLGIKGNIDFDGVFSDQLIDIQGAANNIEVSGTKLKSTQLSAKGNLQSLNFTLASAGTTKLVDPDTPLKIDLNGTYSTTEEFKKLSLRVKGLIDEETFGTTSPTLITSTAEGVDISSNLNIFGGLMSADIQKLDNALNADLSFSDISFERLTYLLGRENLEGAINGEISWQGQAADSTGSYTLSLENAGNKGDSIAHIDLSFVGEFLDGHLVNIFEARNGSDLNIDAILSVPLDVTDGIPALNTTQDASLDIGALGKLEAAWALAGTDSVSLAGFFDLNAQAEAPLFDLRPTGQLTVSEASFEHDRYGARMKNILANVHVDAAGIELLKMNASGIDGGSIDGAGKLFWDPGQSSAMHVDFNKFGAVKQDGLSVNLSGRLDVNRATEGIDIKGDLIVDEAHVNIAQFGSSGVKTIDVIFKDEINEDEEYEPQISPTSKMSLDIDIKADRRIYVTGRGVNIELAADTHIKGTLKKPDVRGTSNIVRGNFSLLGKPFDFTTGVVRLEGNPADAVANLKADRTSDGVTSTITVSGNVRAPQISFSSSPSLPEDEIISRLLFGRSPTQLSAIEAAQLAVAVANMAGDGQGFAPLSELQNAIGLDRLVISQDANSNAQLETGKYLSENVYVELRSRATGQSDLAVEWEPVDNVEVGTVFGNETGARVSVQWKKELD